MYHSGDKKRKGKKERIKEYIETILYATAKLISGKELKLE